MPYAEVAVCSDHRNLVDMFSPGMMMAALAKTTQQLLRWRSYLGKPRFKRVHIPGNESCWIDLLLRWRRTGGDTNCKKKGAPERPRGGGLRSRCCRLHPAVNDCHQGKLAAVFTGKQTRWNRIDHI